MCSLYTESSYLFFLLSGALQIKLWSPIRTFIVNVGFVHAIIIALHIWQNQIYVRIFSVLKLEKSKDLTCLFDQYVICFSLIHYNCSLQCRRQASLVAIKNCKLKATEIVQIVACRLGSVVAVREDNCSEWSDDPYSAGDVARDQAQPMTMQQRLRLATVHIAAKVTVVFELRSARKTKSHKV